jgi:hypothetical protein
MEVCALGMWVLMTIPAALPGPVGVSFNVMHVVIAVRVPSDFESGFVDLFGIAIKVDF